MCLPSLTLLHSERPKLFLSAIGLKDCRKKIGGIPSHLTLPKIEEVVFIIGVFQNLVGRMVLRADL